MLGSLVGILFIAQLKPEPSAMEQAKTAIAILQQCEVPRLDGLEFHEVEIRIFIDELSFREAPMHRETLLTYGWLRPDEGDVVCLDGIPRELVKDNGQADLDEVAKERLGGRPFWYSRDDSPGLIGLLAAGRLDLVRTVFKKPDQTKWPTGQYIEGGIVATYFRRIYNRAAFLYVAGRDHEALALLRQVSLWSAHRAKAIAESKKNLYGNANESTCQAIERLAAKLYSGIVEGLFLEQYSRPEIDFETLSEMSMDSRLYTLFANLDRVKSHGMIVPGGAFFDGDPIFDAIVAEGEAAFSKLLQATTETRLLRLKYQRLPGSLCHIYTIADIARTAMWRIKNPSAGIRRDPPPF